MDNRCMDNRFWVGLAVIVILVIGGLLLLGSNTIRPGSSQFTPGVGGGPGGILSSPVASPSPSSTPSSSQNIVTYSSSGFNPKTITIKVGQTVIWVNQDSALQIASNPHPTHTDYPPLNKVGTIAPGQMRSFTFSTAGTFGYHNHLDPRNSGEVIVEL